jgi:hypothetical protein
MWKQSSLKLVAEVDDLDNGAITGKTRPRAQVQVRGFSLDSRDERKVEREKEIVQGLLGSGQLFQLLS